MKPPFPLIRFGRRFPFALLAVIVLLSAGLMAVGFAWRFHALVDENGPVEDLQLLSLVLAAAAFLFAAIKAGKLQGLMIAVAAALTLMLVQREVDFNSFGEDHWFLWLRSDAFRATFWSLIALALIVWALRLRRPFSDLTPLLSFRRLWPALLALLLIAASLPLELASRGAESRFAANFLLFLEELVELNGYVVVLLVAAAIARRAWRQI